MRKHSFFLVIGLGALCLVLFGCAGAFAQTQGSTAAPTGRVALKVMANVNGQEISRQQLVQACLKDYGAEVIERVVSRQILQIACNRANIVISPEEIQAEIEETAKRFRLPTDQYLSLLERERGISPRQYVYDAVWPSVAVRKLVGATVKVTPEELQKEYERRYGTAVKVRLISCKTMEEAAKIREQAVAKPEDFPKLAQEYSTDPYSASLGGIVPPLRRYTNGEDFEKVLFAMKPGDISQPTPVADMFLILLCEEILPPDPALTLDAVKGELESILLQSKTQEAAQQMSKKLLEDAKVEIIYGNPEKSAKHPGVAAFIDGKVVSVAVLGEECLTRYGKISLEGIINRTLIEQELKTKKMTISEDDIQAELERIALQNLPPKADGQADVDQWISVIQQRFGATRQQYIYDVIWPSCALQKLAAGQFEVTDEDLQRGYESNYGVKVRCRAILLNDMRTAQRVWALAREMGTEESFIELAKKYSMEPGSRANGGEVPPIAKYSGQPILEEAAFKLETGEMSQIISTDGVFIILLCTGRTEPIGVTFEETKDLLIRDITQKKMSLAIANVFEEIKAKATIENYLEGNVKLPGSATPEAPKPAQPSSLQEVPIPAAQT
ncbi:MAG: peptidylprolyl isomerase [Planctomycetia bacterium]|nr:peptidylprolyl isomerase [Planctomycetia bacterium]